MNELDEKIITAFMPPTKGGITMRAADVGQAGQFLDGWLCPTPLTQTVGGFLKG